MEMPHRLAGLRPAIDHDSVADPQLALSRQVIRKLHHSTHQQRLRIGQIREGRNVFCWNNQEVGWRLRVDVFECQQPFTFCHNVCWRGSMRDTTEEAFRIAHLLVTAQPFSTLSYQSILPHVIDRTNSVAELRCGFFRCRLLLCRLLGGFFTFCPPTALFAKVLSVAVIPMFSTEPLAAGCTGCSAIPDPHFPHLTR